MPTDRQIAAWRAVTPSNTATRQAAPCAPPRRQIAPGHTATPSNTATPCTTATSTGRAVHADRPTDCARAHRHAIEHRHALRLFTPPARREDRTPRRHADRLRKGTPLRWTHRHALRHCYAVKVEHHADRPTDCARAHRHAIEHRHALRLFTPPARRTRRAPVQGKLTTERNRKLHHERTQVLILLPRRSFLPPS